MTLATMPAMSAPPPARFASIVGALGTDDFERETLCYLNDTCGVEHYSVYRVRGTTPEFLGGASVKGRHAVRFPNPRRKYRRSYADLRIARQATQECSGALLMHHEIERVDDPELFSALRHFDIVDRVMLCGRAVDDLYALTLLRTRESGAFAPADLERLAGVAELLIAVIAKHASIHWDRPKSLRNFESVAVIEAKLKEADWGLSVREMQVSARILYGISALGISLDLGLGEETIATYRKRLYARLGIGSRHELFQKYLSVL
jgi:DNA-binding CsgD family transcriptional regulator